MTSREQKEYKRKLLKEKGALKKKIKYLNISSYIGHGPNSQEKNIDSDIFNNQQIEADIFINRVSDIDLALFKIERNRYGVCIICKNDIDRFGLNQNPATELCDVCIKKSKTD